MLAQSFTHLHRHIDRLNAQIEAGKVPHARLIHAKPGYGSLVLALAHAAQLLKGNAWDEQVWKLNHPDLHFTFPLVSSGNFDTTDDCMNELRMMLEDNPLFDKIDWVSTIAEDANKLAIISKNESDRIWKKLNLKSFSGGSKVMIIWGADSMNIATANKLLKLIEEPPNDTYIILLAENTEDILPTILSRCQLWRLPPLPLGEVKEALIQNFSLSAEQAQNVAALSEGDFAVGRRHALDHSDGNEFHPLFVNWMRAAYKKDLPALVDWSEEVHKLKRSKQQRFIQYALNFFRQCMIGKYVGNDSALLFGGEKDFAAKFGKFVHGGNIVELMTLLDEAHYHVERNGSAKLIFLDLSVKIIRLLHKKEPYVQKA